VAGYPALLASVSKLLFEESPVKGWLIVATDTFVYDEENGKLYESAKHDLLGNSSNLVKLVSETSGCRAAEFVWEGSTQCSGVFFVVDPFGDCLASLISVKDSSGNDYEPASVYESIDQALESPLLPRCGRIFSCIAMTYGEHDSFIEVDDFSLEESVDEGEYFANFPSISKDLDEGIEVYFKPHPAHGDATVVFRLCWEKGELTEEDEFDYELSNKLQGLTPGNPFVVS
jgi:hypothetical protein